MNNKITMLIRDTINKYPVELRPDSVMEFDENDKLASTNDNEPEMIKINDWFIISKEDNKLVFYNNQSKKGCF